MRRAIPILLLVAACRSAAPTEAPASAPASEAKADEPTATSGVAPERCPELAPREQAQAAFEDGAAQLEASSSGDHFVLEKFEPAIARLREAANAGHAKAQGLLGATLFGMMFTNDAPQPQEREAYIESIAWLRTAAIAGEPKASSFCPGLTLQSPPLHEQPLADVPADWVVEAWRRADAWLACHGPPWM